MIRSAHSMAGRDCIPTRVSSRKSAGLPISRAKSRATRKYVP